MNLDERFGKAQPPGGDGWRTGEKQYTPESLAILNTHAQSSDGNLILIAYMHSVENGCRLSKYMCDSVTLLWLVDDDGNIRMAIEEAVHNDAKKGTIPILRRNKFGSSSWSKLGHPSLLKDSRGHGRIGSELLYTVDGS